MEEFYLCRLIAVALCQSMDKNMVSNTCSQHIVAVWNDPTELIQNGVFAIENVCRVECLLGFKLKYNHIGVMPN